MTSTPDMIKSVKKLSLEQKQLALVVSILSERISGLDKDARDDLFELFKEIAKADRQEDRDAICDTILEILDDEAETPVVMEELGADARSEKFQKWIDYVSTKIREARNEAGMTQVDLAEKSGLPQSHISRIENAKHSPSRVTIEKIAKALEKPVTFFDFNDC